METVHRMIGVARGNMCYQFEEGNDDLLFLIHGIGCNKDSFKSIWDAEEFEGMSVIAVDLMGYGESDAPEEFSYDMKDQAACCLELLKEFKHSKVHIVAHSMGGAVGVLLAEMLELEGDRLSTLVSVEGNLIAEDCGLISRKIIGMSFEYFRNRHYAYLKRSSKNSKDIGVLEWSRELEQASPRAFYNTALALVKWSDSGELIAKFKNINATKYYIYGAKTDGLEVLQRLGAIETKCVEGAGHFVMIENPLAFAVVLARIINK